MGEAGRARVATGFDIASQGAALEGIYAEAVADEGAGGGVGPSPLRLRAGRAGGAE